MAESLGDLVIHDSDGSRTELVAPHLMELAGDTVLSVRACVAHTMTACLPHARPTTVAAFDRLIDTDDILLASDGFDYLMVCISNAEPEVIDPVIDRMLASTDAEVRRAGGRVAAFVALQSNRPVLVDRALAGDAAIRCGLAEVCAARVYRSDESEFLMRVLSRLMHDEDDDVRKCVGAMGGHLRGVDLRLYSPIVAKLTDSPSYTHAIPQIFIALQDTCGRVDELVISAARRFLDLHGADVTDVRHGAAAEVRYISDLVVRGLAQTRDSGRIAELLDIIDRLFEFGAYGVDKAVAGAARN